MKTLQPEEEIGLGGLGERAEGGQTCSRGISFGHGSHTHVACSPSMFAPPSGSLSSASAGKARRSIALVKVMGRVWYCMLLSPRRVGPPPLPDGPWTSGSNVVNNSTRSPPPSRMEVGDCASRPSSESPAFRFLLDPALVPAAKTTQSSPRTLHR